MIQYQQLAKLGENIKVPPGLYVMQDYGLGMILLKVKWLLGKKIKPRLKKIGGREKIGKELNPQNFATYVFSW